MPTRAEEPFLPESVVAEAAKLGIDAKSDADLVRALVREGIDPSSLNKDVSRWLNGEHRPRYTVTLALLRLAGWLDEEAIRLTRGRAEAEAASRAEDRARRLAAREATPQHRRRSA